MAVHQTMTISNLVDNRITRIIDNLVENRFLFIFIVIVSRIGRAEVPSEVGPIISTTERPVRFPGDILLQLYPKKLVNRNLQLLSLFAFNGN